MALLDAVFDQSPVGLGLWDGELRFVRVNPALAAIDGVPAEAHIGRRLEEVVPDLGASAGDAVRRVLDSGGPVLEIELEGETPAAPGELRQWRASFFPIHTGGERSGGVAGLVVDTTDERRAARERERLEAAERAAADWLARLHTAREALTRAVSPADVLAAIEDQGRATARADAVVVALLDDGGRHVSIAHATGPPAANRGLIDFNADVPLAAAAAASWSAATSTTRSRSPTAAGCWSIGDVVGKVPHAAAITALLRYTMRALAAREPGPAALLTAANRGLTRQRDDFALCTAACIQVTRSERGAELVCASAGHPPALIVRDGGEVEFAPLGGLVLGLPRPDARGHRAHARAGRRDRALHRRRHRRPRARADADPGGSRRRARTAPARERRGAGGRALTRPPCPTAAPPPRDDSRSSPPAHGHEAGGGELQLSSQGGAQPHAGRETRPRADRRVTPPTEPASLSTSSSQRPSATSNAS